jgi:hypothetical protein
VSRWAISVRVNADGQPTRRARVEVEAETIADVFDNDALESDAFAEVRNAIKDTEGYVEGVSGFQVIVRRVGET